MEGIWTVITFEEQYKIRFESRDQFIKEIESKSDIYIVDQAYYADGARFYSFNSYNKEECKKGGCTHEFCDRIVRVISKKQNTAMYYIETPEKEVNVYIPFHSIKTVKSLLEKFISLCQKLSLNYPADQYVFTYKNQVLDLHQPLSEIPSESTLKLVKESLYHLPCLFPLEIKPINSKSYTIDVSLTNTIQEIKNKIFKITNVPESEIQLIFNGQELEDSTILKDYNINEESKINLVYRFRGGGGTFAFSSMEKFKTVKFNKKAPKWRVVEPGLSWKGPCINDTCKAYGCNVIINQGFTSINVKNRKDRERLRCPACSRRIGEIVGFGFFRCRYRYEGIDELNKVRKGYGEGPRNNYKAFWSNDKIKWKYLAIEVVEENAEFELISESDRENYNDSDSESTNAPTPCFQDQLQAEERRRNRK